MAEYFHKLTICLILACTILAQGLMVHNAHAGQAPPVTIDKIMSQLAFDKSYKKALLNGKILSTGMPEMEKSREELAVSAVMLVVRAPMEKVVAAYLNGESFRQSDDTMAYHMIHTTPKTGMPEKKDFNTADFTKGELSEVKKLMHFKGGAAFNFSRDEIEQFRSVDPKDPEVQEKVSLILRRILAERCQSYFSRGLMGVRPYERDRGKQSFPGRELTVAVASTQLLENHFPDFYQSLLKYPENIGKNIKNDFYWFKNRLDKRPVFQLCHYMADIRNHYAIVAELRFYVEHTYNSMLTVIGCVPFEGGTVVFCINRTFTDQVAGFGSSLKRNIGRRRIEDTVSKHFAKLRKLLEAGKN